VRTGFHVDHGRVRSKATLGSCARVVGALEHVRLPDALRVANMFAAARTGADIARMLAAEAGSGADPPREIRAWHHRHSRGR